MDLNALLQTILSTGIPASEVLQAIHDSIEYINLNSGSNSRSIIELESLLTLVQESYDGDASSPEVVLARNGRANLKARLDAIENDIAEINSIIELQQPYRETRTRVVSLPFKRIIQYSDAIEPSASHISRAGVAGSQTITYEEEYVNAQPTGRIFNETITNTVAPVDEIYVQGTLILNKTPIRYIRFWNKRAGQNQGRFVELEVFAGGTNIAPNKTVTLPTGATQDNQNAMFDGAKQYTSNIVAHANPYVQLDLGSARTDLTSLKYYLYPLITYDFVRVDVSQDGKSWRRIINRSNYYVAAVGDAFYADVATIYGQPISTYSDAVNSNIPIGGSYTIVAPSIRLYWDSDRALAKNTSQSGLWTQKGTHTVLNKRTVNGVTVYGFSIGWIRDEDNRR